jgi:hypothetical protein
MTEQLRALAIAATPETWHRTTSNDSHWLREVRAQDGAVCWCGGEDGQAQKYAAYIAAANPDAVLALLDEIDRLKSENADHERAYELLFKENAGLRKDAAQPGCLVVSAYRIGSGLTPIKVERVQQLEGHDLWAVRRNGDCLNKDGEWEWEPLPSSRDDEFIKRCRFASHTEAIDAAKGESHAD